jgi:hypothetical protein
MMMVPAAANMSPTPLADRDLGIGDLAAGAGVMLGNESAGLAARHKAQIHKAVDPQMREACPGSGQGRRRSSNGRRHCA